MNLFNIHHLGINFLNAAALWLVPIVLVIISILYWRAKVKRKTFLQALLGPRADSSDYVIVSHGRRALRFFLFFSAMICLIAAMARPFWGHRIIPCENRSRDVMVLFDVSKSMLADDLKPDRLEHAKWLVRQLVSQSRGDRFGLIAFSGRAFLECPLTSDKTSFFNYLNELDTSTIPIGGTNLQLALEDAVKAFKAAEGSNRAVLLLTDGEELSGNSSAVLSALKSKNIPLFVVGIGDPVTPALIPLDQKADGSYIYLKDKQGNPVKTKLNEKQLISLAKRSGGMYVRSTTSNTGLAQVSDAIKDLVPKDLEKGTTTEPIERFYWPLALALILLSLWFVISERGSNGKKHGKSAATTALLIFGSIILLPDSKAQTQNTPPLGEIPLKGKAAKEDDTKKKPEISIEKLYNKGLDLQKKKQPQARTFYEKAISKAAKRPDIRERAFQNMGVNFHNKARGEIQKSWAQVQQQSLDGALKQLDSADQQLNKAEELYVESMANAEMASAAKPVKEITAQPAKKYDTGKEHNVVPAKASNIAVNQQILLRDRKMVAELRKKIKELKKKQEEARKKTQQAKKKQQQQNKQQQNKQNQKQNKQQKQQNKQDQNKQQQNKDQNKQDQNKQQQNKDQNQQNKQQQNKDQNKQDQKKDKQNQQNQQNKQDNKQQQNKDKQNQQNKQDQQKQQDQKQDAKQSLDQARKAVDELQKKAKDLMQKKLEQQASEAKKELDKAKQEQDKKQGNKAEEHIKKALEKLEQMNKQNKKDKNSDDKNKQKQDKGKDNKKQDKKDQQKQGQNKQQGKIPKQQAAQAQGKPVKKDIDPKQARAILRKMAEKEKNLRDAIKAHRKQIYKNIEVEKDW